MSKILKCIAALWATVFLFSCSERVPEIAAPAAEDAAPAAENAAPDRLGAVSALASKNAAQAAEGRPVPKHSVSWSFEIMQDNEDNPVGKVALVVNGNRHEVVAEAASGYRELTRDDYESYLVPAQAETAAASWWAGYGNVIYVSREGDGLEVYRREIFEGDGQEEPFKRILVIEEAP